MGLRDYQAKQMKEAKKRQRREGGIVTRYGNYYTEEEWKESERMREEELAATDEWYSKYQAAIEKAAKVLNREFPDVPVAKWRQALESANPGRIQFTSAKKEERFNAAIEWIGTQC